MTISGIDHVEFLTAPAGYYRWGQLFQVFSLSTHERPDS
jgi:hypothetical protein